MDNIEEEIISSEEFAKIVNNSRLILKDAEFKSIKRDISIILKSFKLIESVDLSLEPYYFPYDIRNSLRDDMPEEKEWEALSNSKRNENRYIKGPKLI